VLLLLLLLVLLLVLLAVAVPVLRIVPGAHSSAADAGLCEYLFETDEFVEENAM
jgi:hypothetical protein